MNDDETTNDQQQLRKPLLVSNDEHDQEDITESENFHNAPTQRTRNTSSPPSPDAINNKNITIPSTPLTPSITLNHNVFLNLVLSVLYGISGSLWGGTVIAAYLKKLDHDHNTAVGNIEAASGMAGLFSALPIGYIADKMGKAKIIRAGGALILVAATCHLSTLYWIGTDVSQVPSGGLWALGVVMAFWGVVDGVVNGPIQALYADSTPEGERSRYYTYLFSAYIMASAVGPIVSIVLFQTLGDDWDLYDLRIIIFVGVGLESINGIIMMFFDDRKALDEDTTNTESSTQESSNTESDTFDDEEGLTSSPTTQQSTLDKRRKYIPYIIFSQGLIFAFGSGMTVKFFPLFFKDEVGMSPTHVQIIYAILPIFMTFFSTLGEKISSTGFGRVPTTILLSSMGILCLLSMVFFKSFLDQHPFILVPIYIIRTSLMNCTYPLIESILMDFVKKEERARWKSLDSVASFGWCGSAAFGGWLADRYDYTYTFFITAIFHIAGTLVFCLLLPLVPRKEGKKDGGNREEEEGGGSDGEDVTEMVGGKVEVSSRQSSSFEEPLLSNGHS